MVKNQLFRVLPEMDIIYSLLQIFGLDSLKDTKFFTKDTLQENNTVQKMKDMKEELQKYYLPCKLKLYVNDTITEKKCITTLRQFIKVQGYTLISKERYIEGKKVSVYRLIKCDDKVSTPKKKDPKNIVLSFD